MGIPTDKQRAAWKKRKEVYGKRTPATAEDIKKQKQERKKREEEKMRLRAELHKKSKERREKIRKAKGGLVKKK